MRPAADVACAGRNAYNYAGSNPWSFVDPLGLKGCKSTSPGYRHNGDGPVKITLYTREEMEARWRHAPRAHRAPRAWECLEGWSRGVVAFATGSDADEVYDQFAQDLSDNINGTADPLELGYNVTGNVTFDEEVRAAASARARRVVIDLAINITAAVASGGTSVVAQVIVWAARGYDVYQIGRGGYSAYTNFRDGNYVAGTIDAFLVILDAVGLAGTFRAPKRGVVREGIYEFPNAEAAGKPYVGQSGDVPSRLQRHQSAGRLGPGTQPRTTSVPGGKTAREIAEHRRIQEITGGSPRA